MSKKKTSEKRGRGQPEKPEHEKRKPLMIRLNQSERLRISKLAAKAGYPVATYLRKKGLGEI